MTRLELMLEDASIKLSSVASTDDESRPGDPDRDDRRRDEPAGLADMARGKMRRKIPELAQALEGHFDAHHARLARSILARIDQVQTALPSSTR